MAEVLNRPHNAQMGRRRSTADNPPSKQPDRHREGAFMVRVQPEYATIIDALLDLDPGSDRTEWVRIAVRERLEKLGKWPPPPKPEAKK